MNSRAPGPGETADALSWRRCPSQGTTYLWVCGRIESILDNESSVIEHEVGEISDILAPVRVKPVDAHRVSCWACEVFLRLLSGGTSTRRALKSARGPTDRAVGLGLFGANKQQTTSVWLSSAKRTIWCIGQRARHSTII